MNSRFKESLGYIKNKQLEDIYQTPNKEEFNRLFVKTPSITILPKREKHCHSSNIENQHIIYYDYEHSAVFGNLYASFLFVFEIEQILDLAEVEGISLFYAEDILNCCNLLQVTSSNVLMYLDDNDFSYKKKYTLCMDLYVVAKNIYDLMLGYHSVSDNEKISRKDPITITKYDTIENHLHFNYIRNSLSLMKLFHILAILDISPMYTDDIHQISKSLIIKLREILFNKRIIKVIIDTDLYSNNDKPHKTTRIKIYFAMGSSDRYCIRLDFPHDGEENIHLNLNEPGKRKSSGFPFVDKNECEVLDQCRLNEVFDSLFYFHDDLYWFRSNYTSLVKKINDKELRIQLEEFLHDREHISILSSDKKSKDAVASFSIALAEALIDYQMYPNIYGSTDFDDGHLYQYMLFLDNLYDLIMKLKYNRKNISSSLFELRYKVNMCYDNYENQIRESLYKHIKAKFSYDNALIALTRKEEDLYSFMSDCIDHLEKKRVNHFFYVMRDPTHTRNSTLTVA